MCNVCRDGMYHRGVVFIMICVWQWRTPLSLVIARIVCRGRTKRTLGVRVCVCVLLLHGRFRDGGEHVVVVAQLEICKSHE